MVVSKPHADVDIRNTDLRYAFLPSTCIEGIISTVCRSINKIKNERGGDKIVSTCAGLL